MSAGLQGARRPDPLRLVIVGLSLSSSWGNGHATTYRALIRGLAARGHAVLFLEADVPWYAAHRDLPDPDFCRLAFYEGPDDLAARFGAEIAAADAVIVGSYVRDGVAVCDLVTATAGGVTAFYDIDTPVTVAGLEAGGTEFLAPRQVADFDLYLSFSGGPILDTLRDRFGARRPLAFHCAADAERYRPVDGPKRWDLGYLGTYSADRQPVLERLLLEPARRLPDRRFVVAGPQYPADIDWPANVERIDHVGPADHPAFYGAQRYTLNVTRADMVAAGWSPSVRLFEAGACATAILSDRWDGLGDLFPDGEAIRIADGPDDVVAALAEPPEATRRLGQAARRIVLARHTGTARAAELEAALAHGRDRPAAPPPSRAVPKETAMLRDARLSARFTARGGRSAEKPAVLVAGGAGFLGSHLCEALVAEGRRVICLDNFLTGVPATLAPLDGHAAFSVVEADICQPLSVEGPIDRIYNLACPASPRRYQADPVHTLMTSVVGTKNLLELARSHGARLLQASTSEVYGDPDEHPQRESYWGNVNPIGIRACYDEGKRAAEALCFDYVRQHGVDVRVARIFNTYGPRMQPDDGRIVSNLVTQALAGRPLTVYGTGEQTRSLCFVSDLIEALQLLMERPENPGVPINLGNPEEYSILELARIVQRMTRSASPIVHEPLPDDDPHVRCPDISRAREMLGWSPRTPAERGLAATIEWFRAGAGAAAERPRPARQTGAAAALVPGAAAAPEGAA
jgi:nucleoside-diphosphate-sugar epimerase/spore maturation protein CgeB